MTKKNDLDSLSLSCVMSFGVMSSGAIYFCLAMAARVVRVGVGVVVVRGRIKVGVGAG